MLAGLNEQEETIPENPEHCIKLQILVSRRPISPRHYAGRLLGFRDELEWHLGLDLEFVGAKSGCIEVYLLPENYSTNTAEYIRNKIDADGIHRSMYRFDISKMYAYGRVFAFKY